MAKKKKTSNFKINLDYCIVWFIFSSLHILPRRAAIALGSFLGDVAYIVLKNIRKTVFTNTKIAFPEMDDAERIVFAKNCFRNIGRQIGEISQFTKATEESLKEMVDFPTDSPQMALYRKEKENGRGIIFLVPHFGGWEVLAFAASAFIGPQHYLVRQVDNPHLDKMFEKMRGKFGNKPINKKNSVPTVLKLLRNGENIGILPDLNASKREGVFVPFFGKLASTTSGVAALAARTNALVIILVAIWDYEKKKYVVEVGSILEVEKKENLKKTIKDFTAKYTKEIENLIRKSPEQWLWTHKRWKTRPDGEEKIY